MTTLSKKMIGYALGRTVLASDRPLIARDGGGRRRRVVLGAGGHDRHQPSVPQPRRRCRSLDAPATAAAASERPFRQTESRYPMSIDHESRLTSRRHFLRGVGVALALPWMESLPVFGQAADSGQGRARRRCASASCSSRTASSRFTGGPRAAARRWSSGPAALPMMPHREDMVFIQGLFNQTRVRLDQPAPRPHERALGRAGQPRSERDPRRHLDGPDPRRRRSAAAPRSRAWCSASSRTSCGSKTACR